MKSTQIRKAHDTDDIISKRQLQSSSKFWFCCFRWWWWWKIWQIRWKQSNLQEEVTESLRLNLVWIFTWLTTKKESYQRAVRLKTRFRAFISRLYTQGIWQEFCPGVRHVCSPKKKTSSRVSRIRVSWAVSQLFGSAISGICIWPLLSPGRSTIFPLYPPLRGPGYTLVIWTRLKFFFNFWVWLTHHNMKQICLQVFGCNRPH